MPLKLCFLLQFYNKLYENTLIHMAEETAGRCRYGDLKCFFLYIFLGQKLETTNKKVGTRDIE